MSVKVTNGEHPVKELYENFQTFFRFMCQGHAYGVIEGDELDLPLDSRPNRPSQMKVGKFGASIGEIEKALTFHFTCCY